MPTRRYRLELAYDGTLFHGWAVQPGLRTVAGVLEEALATILREPITLTVAGRTDAGVHAAHQVAHFDYAGAVPDNFMRRLQGLLTRNYSQLWRREPLERLNRREATSGTSDVVLLRVDEVAADFEARFSALSRRYRYRIADNASERNPLERASQWWVQADLDVERMRQGSAYLHGEHDFLSFCRPREGATTIRSIRSIGIERRGGIEITPVADAFCHSMVRSIVGALVDVGCGAKDPEWVGTLIDFPSREHGVRIAPACGLVLEGVDYPPPEEWALRSSIARRRRDECCS